MYGGLVGLEAEIEDEDEETEYETEVEELDDDDDEDVDGGRAFTPCFAMFFPGTCLIGVFWNVGFCLRVSPGLALSRFFVGWAVATTTITTIIAIKGTSCCGEM